MHSRANAIPLVELLATPMTEVIYEMSRKKLGLATVVEGGMAVWTDQRRRPAAPARSGKDRRRLKLTAEDAMNAHPKTIASGANWRHEHCTSMEELKITSLVVVGPKGRHDRRCSFICTILWGLDLI